MIFFYFFIFALLKSTLNGHFSRVVNMINYYISHIGSPSKTENILFFAFVNILHHMGFVRVLFPWASSDLRTRFWQPNGKPLIKGLLLTPGIVAFHWRAPSTMKWNHVVNHFGNTCSHEKKDWCHFMVSPRFDSKLLQLINALTSGVVRLIVSTTRVDMLVSEHLSSLSSCNWSMLWLVELWDDCEHN